MAKPLNERIASAKSTDRVTITDLEALIADATAERDRQLGASEHHAAEAINLALSDDDREEADRLAQHCRRTAKAYATAIDELTEKLEEKRSSDKQKAEEARIAAITGRRDDLAARLKDRLPALLDELVGLLEEIETNDAEIEPLRLESAEAVARGVPGNFYEGPSPVGRFVKMKIPAWDGRGIQWPIDRHAQAIAKRQQAEHQQMVARKQAEAAEAARWSRYLITPPDGNNAPTIKTHRGTEQVRVTIERRMTVELVEAARKAGCTVAELKPSERFGLPTAAAFVS